MNQKDLIKYALIALGAYLIYEYIQKNGGLSGIFGTTAAAGTGPTPPIPGVTPKVTAPGTTPTDTTPTGPTPPHPGGWLPTDYVPCVGGIAVWNSGPDQSTANFKGTPQDASLVKCVMPTAPINQPPVNPPNPQFAVDQTVSQQMIALAGTSDGLSMDQWCYEFTAVTGQQCPLDPGSITPQQFQDAGVQGDRSTPTSIGTWLAFMNVYGGAAGAGISGLWGLGARYTPAWLM